MLARMGFSRPVMGLLILLCAMLLAPIAALPVASMPAGDPPAAAGGSAARREATVTIVLQPAKDNTLYQSSVGAVSNGRGEHLFVGRTGQGEIRRGLLAFDVAGAIPTFATVISATLELHMSRSDAGAKEVQVHVLQAEWGEGSSAAAGNEGAGAAASPGDATWLHTFFDTSTWQKPGGDYRAEPSASTLVGDAGVYRWQSAQLAADVQQWLDDAETNHGWLLLGDESSAHTAKRFDTRDSSLADQRPALSITYAIPLFDLRLYLPLVQRR